MTTHARLGKSMRSPYRSVRRDKKERRQAKFVIEDRPRAYQEHRLPPEQLRSAFWGSVTRPLSMLRRTDGSGTDRPEDMIDRINEQLASGR